MKLRFNKTRLAKLAAIAVSGSLMLSPLYAGAAGIPVFDGASVAQAIQQGIQMAQQIDNQIKQIKELESQVKSLTGSRNLGKILTSTALDQLPPEWKSVYSAAKDKNYKDLLSYKNFNPDGSKEAMVRNYDIMLKALEDSKARMKNIGQLMDEINRAQDIKAAADLQNRLSAENAIIQNNQTRLDMMARVMEMEEKIQVQKRSDRDTCLYQNILNGTSRSCS